MIILNQILIDFLRLNSRALQIDNKELGKALDEIITNLGGKQTQSGRVSAGRDNETGAPYGFPKS